MSRLLITGGAGFIGANFVHYWSKKYPGDRLIVLDALTYAGNPDSLKSMIENPSYQLVHGDIADQKLVEELLAGEAIDTIVNFAAESHVDRSIHGPDQFIATNIVGTHSLLKAARNVWLSRKVVKEHRFHHVSTDEVYGSLKPGEPAFVEETPYAPNSPYSASKGASDHLVRAYHHTYGLETTISNCSNNYGPYQFPEKLIPLVIINILQGRAIPIYGDGLYIRDWLYVEDHCRAIDLILRQGRSGEVYNVGGNNEWTNIDIVGLLCGYLNEAIRSDRTLAERFPASPAARGRHTEELITYVADRPGHDRRYAINSNKIGSQLGFLPVESFESGIKKTIDWYLAHQDWWEAVLDGRYREWVNLQYGSNN